MIQPTAIGKNVKLMMTCLCDGLYPDVAKATYRVLERVGCRVEVPEAQSCCGQPALNAGDWVSARKVFRHTRRTFDGEEPIVTPSGSCAAMMRHGAVLAFESETDLGGVKRTAARTWELAEFLVLGLGIDRWPGRFNAKVSLHRSCHTRGTGAYESALALLGSIEGLEIATVGELEQCCGFGGTFCVSHPTVSNGMGQLKVEHLMEAKPDVVAGVDMACLMHIGGLMDRQGIQIERLHVAQILMRALEAENV